MALPLPPGVDDAQFRAAMQKMAEGSVQPVIDMEVGLDDIAPALKRMEGRQVFGKIILRMSDAQDG